MIEFEVQTPRQIRLRVGRWHFRTWRSWAMPLPKGYRSPENVWEVIQFDANDEIVVQHGAFFSEEAAWACLRQLESEGNGRLGVNLLPVHARLQDWQFDR